ncbi:MAG: AI-2E family transporter [Pseudomonadales bacterium]|jgi:predicted PurR-regulated permease PerM|nr:AI-2E family transporter [Pseudomonadales bacterium]
MSVPVPRAGLWPWLLVALAVGVLVYLLRPILMPFLVATLFAYLGDPLVDRLEQRGLGRTGAVLLVFSSLTLLGVGALLVSVPLLGSQIELLYARMPAALDWLQNDALPWVEATFGVPVSHLDLAQVRSVVIDNWQSTSNVLGSALAGIGQSGLAFVALLTSLALIPVVTFYLLRDWDLLIARIGALLPREAEPVIVPLARECDEVVSAFLRGQMLVMAALGLVYGVGLWIVGLEFALIIGLVAGLASIVPYLGFVVGFFTATLATLFQFDPVWLPLLGVAAVFTVGQMLEGFVLTPWLVGDRIGLHPVAVIFAVLAGGQLFGFTGILLALPVAAMIAVALRHAHEPYLRSRFYAGGTGDAADARPPREP